MVALTIAFSVDRIFWSDFGPWNQIEVALEDCGGQCRVVSHKAHSHSELARLWRSDRDRWRVVVVGSSRAGAGFLPETLPKNDPALATLHLFKVASAATEPYTMRSLASRFNKGDADEVVLYLSEFDTHRPPYIVPSVGFGGFGAWIDLVRYLGPRPAWRHREGLRRLAAAAAIHTYRNRDVLQALTRGYALRPGPIGARNDMASVEEPPGAFRNALAMQPSLEAIMPWDEFQTVSAKIQTHLSEPMVEGPFRQVRVISRGRHTDLQMSLVRATIDVLLKRNIRVLIVEAPIHPLAEALYDLETRIDFRAFAADLASDERVEVLELRQLAAFRADEFGDLTHLSQAGARRHTRALVDLLANHAQTSPRAAR